MEPRKRTLRSAPTLKIPSGTDEESKVHHGRLSRLHRGVRARSQAQRMTVKVLASTFAFLLFSFYVLLELISRSSALVSPTARILHQDLPEFVPSTSGTMEQILLPKRPRVIGYYFENSKTESHIGTERIDPNFVRLYKSHAGSGMTAEEWERQEDLKASEDYRYGRADVLETGDCVAQYEWQKRSFPSCNSVLEQDMTDLGLDANGKDSVRLIANGYWRDVWRIQSESDRAVLKTLRYEHDWEERNYDRHRRDAVAMERLTASPHVIDIYAFCGNSGVFEFADGGSVEDQIWYESDLEDWSAEEKLAIAHQLVSGLADFHNVEKEGVPAMAHADITPSQFVYVKETGTYKLNDFNRCRFIPINNKTNELCPYFVGNNPGTFRSPEEYAYLPQTEKIDIYSLGNVFYGILTERWPFYKVYKDKEAQKRIIGGERPEISEFFRNSTSPFDKAMIKVIEMCWTHDPKERPPARKIQSYIAKALMVQGK